MKFRTCASPRFGLEVKSDPFSFHAGRRFPIGWVTARWETVAAPVRNAICSIWLMALQASFRNSFSGCCIVLACQHLLLQQNTLQTSSALQLVQRKAVRRLPVSGPSLKCNAVTGQRPLTGRSNSRPRLAMLALLPQLNCQSHFPHTSVQVRTESDSASASLPFHSSLRLNLKPTTCVGLWMLSIDTCRPARTTPCENSCKR